MTKCKYKVGDHIRSKWNLFDGSVGKIVCLHDRITSVRFYGVLFPGQENPQGEPAWWHTEAELEKISKSDYQICKLIE